MRQAALLFFTPLLFASAANANAGESTHAYLSEGELQYVGYLDEDANARLFALYDGLATKPTVLAIRSRGGDVVPGMALGEWVHAHKLDVKVMEFCLSSCANYVFTAGSRKIVSNLAMIGYHGGMSSMHFDVGGSDKEKYAAMTPAQQAAYQAGLRKDVQPLLDRETAFFKTIGVRQDITTWGHQSGRVSVEQDGWTYTQDGFRRFGVDRIEVINPPWVPRLLTLKSKLVTLDGN
jgi:hypothetical protein